MHKYACRNSDKEELRLSETPHIQSLVGNSSSRHCARRILPTWWIWCCWWMGCGVLFCSSHSRKANKTVATRATKKCKNRDFIGFCFVCALARLSATLVVFISHFGPLELSYLPDLEDTCYPTVGIGSYIVSGYLGIGDQLSFLLRGDGLWISQSSLDRSSIGPINQIFPRMTAPWYNHKSKSWYTMQKLDNYINRWEASHHEETIHSGNTHWDQVSLHSRPTMVSTGARPEYFWH